MTPICPFSGFTCEAKPCCDERLVLEQFEQYRRRVVPPKGAAKNGLERAREALAEARGDYACPTQPIRWECPDDAQAAQQEGER